MVRIKWNRMSTENSSNVDFKATFTLLPQVLKIYKAIQTKQPEPQKQQAQIQTAVSALLHYYEKGKSQYFLFR